MRINEIALQPDKEEDIINYLKYFEKYQIIKKLGGFDIVENKVDEEEHWFGIFDGNNLISLLRLFQLGLNYRQVVYTLTDPAYRGQGCFRELLLQAVKEYGGILSDTNQSISSSKAWKSIILDTNSKLRISIYDPTSEKILINNITIKDFERIWNPTLKLLLLATEK